MSFCKVTNTSSDSRENLLEELRWIASARISDPNDLSLKETVEEDILPYDKVKRLYHSEYEKELDDRILRLIPLDETPIPSEDKKILRYYINLQLEFYSEAIGHYPELRRGYEKKRVRLINMRGNLEL